jgi:hypothetical protein
MEKEILTAPNNMVEENPRKRQEKQEQQPLAGSRYRAAENNDAAFFFKQVQDPNSPQAGAQKLIEKMLREPRSPDEKMRKAAAEREAMRTQAAWEN